VREAIRKTADRAFEALSAEDQRAARQLFLRLVTPGEGQEDTRARAEMPSEPAQLRIVEQFAGPRARLLVTGSDRAARPTVEVAHEALIRTWPRLREWVDSNREKLRTRAAVVQAKAVWEDNGRREDLLLPAGFQLERARALLQESGDLTIDDIQEFVILSSAREETERKEREAALARDEAQVAELKAAQARTAAAQARTAKWQRITRWAIAAVAAVILIASPTVAYLQLDKGQQLATKEKALAERDRAQRVLSQVFGNVNRRVELLSLKRQGETPRAEQAPAIQVSQALDPRSQSPLQQGNDLVEKGTALLATGDVNGAHSLFEQALRILESGTEIQLAEQQWQLARFNVYGRLAKAARRGGDLDAALAALTKGAAFVQDRAEADPNAVEWRERRAVLLQGIGDLHLEQGRVAEAGQQYREAAALWRQLANVPELLPRAQQELASSLTQLGDIELKQSHIESALGQYRESVSLLEQLVSSGRSGPDLQGDLSAGYQQIVDALLSASRAKEALIWADKDMSISMAALAAHPGPNGQRDLASSYGRRAHTLAQLGRDPEALEAYKKGVALLEAAAATKGAEANWQHDAAVMLHSMGALLAKMGQSMEALYFFQRALSLREGIAILDVGWQIELEMEYRNIVEFMGQMVGRELEARETAERYLFAASLLMLDLQQAERIARALGTLCWAALLAGDIPRAEWAGQHAVELAPKLDWVRTNYAAALMLSGKRERARQIYLTTGSLSPDAAQKWKDRVLSDFLEMKKRRLEDSLMGEIIARFTAKTSGSNELQ
jgi:tetratricopeptide (TPR) repeat protein